MSSTMLRIKDRVRSLRLPKPSRLGKRRPPHGPLEHHPDERKRRLRKSAPAEGAGFQSSVTKGYAGEVDEGLANPDRVLAPGLLRSSRNSARKAPSPFCVTAPPISSASDHLSMRPCRAK